MSQTCLTLALVSMPMPCSRHGLTLALISVPMPCPRHGLILTPLYVPMPCAKHGLTLIHLVVDACPRHVLHLLTSRGRCMSQICLTLAIVSIPVPIPNMVLHWLS
ncbi:hypothetical protein F383_23796 [Gossypium arboreum]|uniref:Uncharacterized protein n=1 Tax=Gossypium arboreum TaxID=29729 RepID=A0A0B0NUX9_GOSAR|nr:hypothetical protein F383_23796 [Gossypium arboreum]